jgi:predicted acylesterase/phospholipase RssA
VHFENVVFSGGGNRCFWQAGFWSEVAPRLTMEPCNVTAVSAGSAIACALFSETFERGFAKHKRAVQRNPRNLYVRNLLKSQSMFPHGSIYRSVILESIDEVALHRLRNGPDINIVVARSPNWASSRMAVLLGALSVGIDAWNGNSLESATARGLGFKPMHVPVRECQTPDALADLILASSCIPPLTPLAWYGGIPLLDGGLVGSVPMQQSRQTKERTLILLTRRFPTLPVVPNHTYVQPSEPIPVGVWDYTDDAAIQSAYELGRRDGEAFCISTNNSHLREAHEYA